MDILPIKKTAGWLLVAIVFGTVGCEYYENPAETVIREEAPDGGTEMTVPSGETPPSPDLSELNNKIEELKKKLDDLNATTQVAELPQETPPLPESTPPPPRIPSPSSPPPPTTPPATPPVSTPPAAGSPPPPTMPPATPPVSTPPAAGSPPPPTTPPATPPVSTPPAGSPPPPTTPPATPPVSTPPAGSSPPPAGAIPPAVAEPDTYEPPVGNEIPTASPAGPDYLLGVPQIDFVNAALERGNDLGSPVVMNCDKPSRDTVVTGFQANTDRRIVTGMRLFCGRLWNQQWTALTFTNSVGDFDEEETRGSDCPVGFFPVGIHGGVGYRIDRFGLICRQIPGQPNQPVGIDRTLTVGGGGGRSFEEVCPLGQVLTGVRLRAGDEPYGAGLGIFCSPIIRWNGHPVSE